VSQTHTHILADHEAGWVLCIYTKSEIVDWQAVIQILQGKE